MRDDGHFRYVGSGNDAGGIGSIATTRLNLGEVVEVDPRPSSPPVFAPVCSAPVGAEADGTLNYGAVPDCFLFCFEVPGAQTIPIIMTLGAVRPCEVRVTCSGDSGRQVGPC